MNRASHLHVLLLDNRDSFVFNLADEFARRGCVVETWRNTSRAELVAERLAELPAPRLLVLSPGPGHPTDAGCCLELVRLVAADTPVFGVCLGHQAIVLAHEGHVAPAGEIIHGKATPIHHDGSEMFAGLPSPLAVGRYHSLLATTNEAPALRVVAQTSGEQHGTAPMAVVHAELPRWGVQFHPESLLTPHGGRLLENVISWARRREWAEATKQAQPNLSQV